MPTAKGLDKNTATTFDRNGNNQGPVEVQIGDRITYRKSDGELLIGPINKITEKRVKIMIESRGGKRVDPPKQSNPLELKFDRVERKGRVVEPSGQAGDVKAVPTIQPPKPLGYHDRDEISTSRLKVFMSSRKDYRDYYVTKDRKEKKAGESADFGHVCHAVVLEGKAARSIVAKYPESCFNPKKLTADGHPCKVSGACPEFEKQNPDYEYFMAPWDFDRMREATRAVRSHEHIAPWIDSATCEKEIFWTCPMTGLK